MTIFVRSVLLATAIVSLMGCDRTVDLSAVEPKWDRDVCERCKMHVSDKHYSSQIVNPDNGRHYYFDDLGCAVSWLEEQPKEEWMKRAIVYANDAKSGEWTDVRTSVMVTGFVTPMAFGVGVFKNAKDVPDGKQVISLDAAKEQIASIKKEKMRKRAMHSHQ